MTENDLINATIDDGIAEIEAAYLRPDQREKREGGVAGFEFCRGKSEASMRAEADRVHDRTCKMIGDADPQNYWYWVCYARQIEWVLNVLHGARHATGQPHDACTARGVVKAAEIIGTGVLELRN